MNKLVTLYQITLLALQLTITIDHGLHIAITSTTASIMTTITNHHTIPPCIARLHCPQSHRYRADEVARRAVVASVAGLSIVTRTRMVFEQPAIVWQVDLTNSADAETSVAAEFELTAMVHEYAHVSWVLPVPFDPANFKYAKTGCGTSGGGICGVMAVGNAPPTPSIRPAASVIAFVDDMPEIDLPARDVGVPRALFRQLLVAPGVTRTLRVVMAVANTSDNAMTLALSTAGTAEVFDMTWAECHDKWEARWHAAFNNSDAFFSGSLPILDLEGASDSTTLAADVTRVYYASVLSIVSQMRTNLPLMYNKASAALSIDMCEVLWEESHV